MTVIRPAAPFSRSRRVRAAEDAGPDWPGTAGTGTSRMTTNFPRTSPSASLQAAGCVPDNALPAKTRPPEADHSAVARTLEVKACGKRSVSSPARPDTRM